MDKTDRLDTHGVNQLQRTGTLPTVWIPPSEVRDWRDLPRTRMVLVRQRTQLKNRIHATLAKYALTVSEVADLFGKQGRILLRERLAELRPQTAFATTRVLEQIESLDRQVDLFERQMGELFEVTDEIELLMTLPGVGFILATVILGEIGDVARFGRSEQLAAYAGTTPRVHESGGRRRYGPLQADVKPLPQMGVCGGGQRGLPAPEAALAAARQPPLRPYLQTKGVSEGDRGRGPPLGGGGLLGTDEA